MTRTSVLALVAGVSALVATVAYAGAEAVEQAVLRVGAAGLLVLALLRLPIIAVAGLGWFALGRDLPGAPPWKFIWARYVREATAEVLPFSELGGIVAGARTLTLSGLPSVPVSATLLADLLIEQVAKLPYVLAGAALVLFGAWSVPPRLIIAAVLPVSVLTVLAVGGRKHLAKLFGSAAGALARRWPVLRMDRTAAHRAVLERAFTWDRRTTAAMSAHLLGWVLGAAETWVTCALMGLAVTPVQALVIDSLFCGIRTVAFAMPAALGVQEVGYVLVCALVGVPPAPAVALSLVRRVRELLVGVPALGVWQMWEGGRALAGLSDK